VGKAIKALIPEWIRVVSNSAGEVGPGESIEITVEIDSSALSTGEHLGSAVIELLSPYALKSQISITLNSGAFSGGLAGSDGIYLQEPRNVQVTNNEVSETIDLTWSAVTGAQDYSVMRADKINGDYVSVGTADTNSFSDTSASADQLYFYQIIANFSEGTSGASDTVGAMRTEKTADIALSTLQNLSTTAKLGDSISFNLKYTNQGLNDVSSGIVRFSIPAGLSFVSGSHPGGNCGELDRSITCLLGASVCE